ncbi:MAG: hypothetical protein ACREPN_02975 [Rudaea sp.]
MLTIEAPGGFVRVLNHFYDPINNEGLTSGCSLSYNGVCAKSVDWALGYADSFATPPMIDTSRGNHFSYEDARVAMWDALTLEVPDSNTPAPTADDRNAAAIERLYQWATAFRSLGDVVHLLQDTAQPQHTRNDPHSFINSPEQQAFEGFTNARVLGQPVSSLGGEGGYYVRGFFGDDLSAVVTPPPLGSYTDASSKPVTFATPLRFFTTRLAGDTSSTSPDNRYGLADYTNRGFFTGGTVPGTSTDPYNEPPQSVVDGTNGYTAVSVPCLMPTPNIYIQQQRVSCTHYTRTVSDTVNSGYSSQDMLPAGFTQPPLVAEGVFAQFINSFVPGTNYVSEKAIGIEELVTMANLTIPRAIGYSTGMLNYFFRGTIDVETSNSAVLAVLNQGAVHSMNEYGYPCVGNTPADGCSIFGFTQLRLKLHNTTPDIVESGTGTDVPQTMIATTAGAPDFSNPNSGNAYLVAVARYHRNACYTPALGGLPVKVQSGTTTNPPTTCAAGSVRTPYQEVSVSQSIAVTAATLNSATATEEIFDFSADPIPVNATDLFIQVMYRGPLGQEQDGIAVGTLDIPEPAFIAFWNNTDYFLNTQGHWTADTSAPNIRTPITQMEICGGGKQVYQFSSGGAGDVIGYPGASPDDNPGSVRLAVLSDPFPSNPNHTVGIVGKATVDDTKQPPDIQFVTKPYIVQANVEDLPDVVLATPTSTCATTDPTQTACWRFDPVQQRRGLLWGAYWAPVYIDESGGATPPDVDAPPSPLPAWTTTTVTTEGAILFNNATLTNCVF